MSKKIIMRSVLKKHKLVLIENKITQTCYMSKHSVKAVFERLNNIDNDLELNNIDNCSDEIYSQARYFSIRKVVFSMH